MRTCVIGATGFLGTALCRRLDAQGDRVTRLNSKNCDLTRQGSLDQFAEEKYDHIYHLAAWTQAGDFCLSHMGEQWIINQQINTHVLAWWQKHQPQARMICTGSSCVYDPTGDLAEESYLIGTPIDSLFTYAMTKRMQYVGLLALHGQFGLKYLVYVPSTLYGPGYHSDGRQMHFIFDLIRKIVRGKLHGEPVILWGDGHQKRELVYVDDFADIMCQLSARRENEVINIGAGEEFPIRHFAKLICDRIGYDFSRVQFDTSRYVGARSKCLCVRKLKKLLPGLALTPLEEGLMRTIDWYLKDLQTFRTP